MIRVHGLKCSVGQFRLHIDLQIRDSEYFVLLGMSGAGKTMFLECLCGLRPLSEGAIWFDSREISQTEPRSRRIGYVPQDAVLFQHLSVAGNLGFGRRIRRSAHLDPEVIRVAEWLGIHGLLKRSVRGLSGGECQRVALGRALMTQPEILLLDEPVSALDEWNRRSVCAVLRSVQETMNIPVIHVCHSRSEAAMVAGRIGIMHAGEIVQTGSLDEVESRPSSQIVARVMGLDNVLEGTWSMDPVLGKLFRTGRLVLPVCALAEPAELPCCHIPPSAIVIRSEAEGQKECLNLDATVSAIRGDGPNWRVAFKESDSLVACLSRKDPAAQSLSPGQRVYLVVPLESVQWIR